MANIASNIYVSAGLIEYSLKNNDYEDADDATDLDFYLNTVFLPPQGFKVMGSAIEVGVRKIILFRGLSEFQQAFSALDPSEQSIHFFFGCACEFANLPVAQYLLAMGADVNGDGETEEDWFVSWMMTKFNHEANPDFRQRHFDVFRFLLTVPEFNPLGNTMEGNMWLCMFLYPYPLDIVEGFLRKGATPNHFDDGTDDRPLCLAAISNNFELVELLLRYGANPTLRDGEGRLPSDCTEDEKILGVLLYSLPYMQVLYCFRYIGVELDADSVADFVACFSELLYPEDEDEDE